jgi:putative glutathione S-transferase
MNPVNNGVYKSGFARTQAAYDKAVTALFCSASMNWSFTLMGENGWSAKVSGQLTEADICLFTTLVRFDLVYVVHFKCNLRRIIDYPNLQSFVERMIDLPGVKETCHWQPYQGSLLLVTSKPQPVPNHPSRAT